MIIHNVLQGSPEWHALRARCDTASEASIMMGASKKTSRSELLRMKATGSEKEFSGWVQKNLLDKGHEIEAAARPGIEAELLKEELYPCTATSEEFERLLASFDGVTLLEDTIWECKSWNEEKAASVRKGVVPDEDYWQVVQQLVVSRASKCIYTVTDGTADQTLSIPVTLSSTDEKALLAGWAQFNDDLASYEHKEAKPEAVAAPQEALPALVVQVSGSLAITDNLDVFGQALNGFVDRLNLEPKTDQDFADLEAASKALKKAEDALTSEEDRALAQADGIEALRRTVAQYRELARTTRLRAEKVVKAEKENRRNEIRMAALDAFRLHVEQINATLEGRIRMPDVAIDVVGAMKGKKTISSLEDAADTEVARAKIEANRVADLIRINIASLNDLAKDHKFLFSDAQELVLKSADDLRDLIKARIIAHEAGEKRKLEAERERIRTEEEAKARREAEAKAEQERQRIRAEEQAKAKAEAEAQAKAFDALNSTEERLKHSSPSSDSEARIPASHQKPLPTKTRPTDQEIIAALMRTFGADRADVIEWIACMDLEEVA